MSKPQLSPTLLLILDGWGLAPAGEGNAISLAKTPNMDKLYALAPHSKLEASGLAVGLPYGYIGNSEVGHLNIGAGSIVYQDMTRIDLAMESGELSNNQAFIDLLVKTHAQKGRLHLAGLLSDGGVHSHYRHMQTLVKKAVEQGLEVFIHCFMDGRDTAPGKGITYLKILEDFLIPYKSKAKIASISGRFFAMDRDKHFERLEKVWNMLVHGKSNKNNLSASEVVANYYKDELYDEFIPPTLLIENGTWQDNDGLFLWNFRADRMRQLVQILTLVDFKEFERKYLPKFSGIVTMTKYDATFNLPVAFPKNNLSMGLGEVVSTWGYKQLRIAETEKYAHVTYFFNGGREEPFPLEDRILIPSPRHIETYDLAPEMSCHEVTKACSEAIRNNEYTLIVCNLANCDMVGHTGNLNAAILSCEVVDTCLGELMQSIETVKGRILIVADHGNCETMLDANGKKYTAHTTNPVPCILYDTSNDSENIHLSDGKLADIAPTLIKLWKQEVPVSMHGIALIGA